MAVNWVALHVAKTSPQALLEADLGEEVLEQDKTRVRRQVLRFEAHIQIRPGFTSNIGLAMFHVSGLRLIGMSFSSTFIVPIGRPLLYMGGSFVTYPAQPA